MAATALTHVCLTSGCKLRYTSRFVLMVAPQSGRLQKSTYIYIYTYINMCFSVVYNLSLFVDQRHFLGYPQNPKDGDKTMKFQGGSSVKWNSRPSKAIQVFCTLTKPANVSLSMDPLDTQRYYCNSPTGKITSVNLLWLIVSCIINSSLQSICHVLVFCLPPMGAA